MRRNAYRYRYTEPDILTLSEVHTNVSCHGNKDGAISISVSGGTPAYHYFWSDGSTSDSRIQLSPGSYSVTVNECSRMSCNNGCDHQRIATYDPEYFGQPSTCKSIDDDGSISLTVTVADYLFVSLVYRCCR